MSRLTIRGVGKSFGRQQVLGGLDLTVEAGTLAAVLGPSGCGKTTLLRVIAGFEPVDAGAISINGEAVAGPGRHVAPERRRIAIVPQDGALFPHLSVAANVAFGLPRGGDRNQRVEQMLKLLGLAGFGSRMPHELSGGQQQRVALARALSPGPRLVLLDEPFNALDTALRAAVRADVCGALRETGATALLVTHDQQEALSVADTVAIMRDGRIVQSAPPEELYSRPADLGVAVFVGDAVVLPGVAERGYAECAFGRVPLSAGSAAGRGQVVVRPEQIELGSSGDGDGDGLTAYVRSVEFFGHDAMVRVTLIGGSTEIKARTVGGCQIALGDEVSLRVRGPALFYPEAPTPHSAGIFE